jgi:hypothetical protein
MAAACRKATVTVRKIFVGKSDDFQSGFSGEKAEDGKPCGSHEVAHLHEGSSGSHRG